jgi:hypothetical protein
MDERDPPIGEDVGQDLRDMVVGARVAERCAETMRVRRSNTFFNVPDRLSTCSSSISVNQQIAAETRMADNLEEYLAHFTTTTQAYPATAFHRVTCPCGSDHFTLDRAGTITRRVCTGCGQVRYIDRFGTGDGWLEAVEDQEGADAFFCEACGNDEARVCLGFAGYPESPDIDAVKWYYVGVRCTACGADECFNDGKVGRGPMAELVFRQIDGEQPLEEGDS